MAFPITIEQIEAAYQKTGLKKADRCFFKREYVSDERLDFVYCACPIGAVLRAAVLDQPNPPDLEFISTYEKASMKLAEIGITLSLTQVREFADGFDDLPNFLGNDAEDETVDKEAYAAGKAARARLLPMGA